MTRERPTKDESDTEFVIGHSLWDEGDYVVTIRPDYEKSWRSLPLGGVLSERRARLIAEWLQGAMPTLWTIFKNVSRGKIESERDPKRLCLLEAIAEAMLAVIVAYGFSGDGSADQLHEAMAAGRRAQVAATSADYEAQCADYDAGKRERYPHFNDFWQSLLVALEAYDEE